MPRAWSLGCPKCVTPASEVEWHPGWGLPCRCRLDCRDPCAPEHLCCVCAACGYTWAQATADSPPAAVVSIVTERPAD